jgi:hypothetical protein
MPNEHCSPKISASLTGAGTRPKACRRPMDGISGALTLHQIFDGPAARAVSVFCNCHGEEGFNLNFEIDPQKGHWQKAIPCILPAFARGTPISPKSEFLSSQQNTSLSSRPLGCGLPQTEAQGSAQQCLGGALIAACVLKQEKRKQQEGTGGFFTVNG